jgi:hypothetical protein
VLVWQIPAHVFVVPQFGKFLCAPLRFFAYFAVKKPLKQLTAKSAKNAKITKRVNFGQDLFVGPIPAFFMSGYLTLSGYFPEFNGSSRLV